MSWNQDPQHPGQPPRPAGAPAPNWNAIMQGSWAPWAPAPAQAPQSSNEQNPSNDNQPRPNDDRPQPDDNRPQPNEARPPDNKPSPASPSPSATKSSTSSPSPSQTLTLSHPGPGHDIRSALAFGVLLLIACIALLSIIFITMHRRMKTTGTYFKSRPELPDDEKRLAPYPEDEDEDQTAETETITIAFPDRNSIYAERPLPPVLEGEELYDLDIREQIAGHRELAEGIVTPSQSRPVTPAPEESGATWLPWYRGSFRSLRSHLSRGGGYAAGAPSSGSPSSSRETSFRRPLRNMLRRSGTY